MWYMSIWEVTLVTNVSHFDKQRRWSQKGGEQQQNRMIEQNQRYIMRRVTMWHVWHVSILQDKCRPLCVQRELRLVAVDVQGTLPSQNTAEATIVWRPLGTRWNTCAAASLWIYLALGQTHRERWKTLQLQNQVQSSSSCIKSSIKHQKEYSRELFCPFSKLE